MMVLKIGLQNVNTLEELAFFLERARGRLSIWGAELISIPNYSGRVSLHELALNVARVIRGASPLDLEKREKARTIVRQFNQIHGKVQTLAGASSCLTRIFVIIRKCLGFRSSREFNISREEESWDGSGRILDAIRSGRPVEELHELLVRYRMVLLPDDFGRIVIETARQGNHDACRIFLPLWPISHDEWGVALLESIRLGNLPNVVLLSSREARILPKQFDEAVLAASKKREDQFLRELIRFRELNPFLRSRALVESLKADACDCALLLTEGNPHLLDEALAEAAMLAATKNNLLVLGRLLESGKIDEETRGLAVVRAARLGHLNAIEVLIRDARISIISRVDAILEAAKNGRLDIVNQLKASGPVFPNTDWNVNKLYGEWQGRRLPAPDQ